jgi:hypothetical protein
MMTEKQQQQQQQQQRREMGSTNMKEQTQWLYLVLSSMIQQQGSPAAALASLVSAVALAFHAAKISREDTGRLILLT